MFRLGLYNSVSLKLRVLFILVGVSLASWYCYMTIGIKTFISDKESYISDYVLTRVKNVTTDIEDRIEKTVIFHRVLSNEGINAVKDYSKALGIKKALTFKVGKEGVLRPLASIGDDDETFSHILDQFGWDAQKFASNSVLVRKNGKNELIVGSMVRVGESDGIVCITSLQLNLKYPEPFTDFQIEVIDSLGDSAIVMKSGMNRKHSIQTSDLLMHILNVNRLSGLTKWKSDHTDYYLGFQKLRSKELTIVGIMPEGEIFVSIRGIILRTVFIGLGILLIAFGLCVLFLRDVSSSLEAMSAIIDKFTQGTFSVRVNTQGIGNSEIGTLATSFNIMAEKIDEMMANVASKVKEKFNSEASEMIQQNLLPKRYLEKSQFHVSGKVLASSDYGGDWWFHQQLNDYVLVIVGKAGSHGYPGAIITAVMHATTTTYMTSLKSDLVGKPNLSHLVSLLNQAVFEVTQGNQLMECFFSLVDTRTGEMEMVNMATNPPYLHRPKLSQKSEDPTSRFKQLNGRKYTSLGVQKEIAVESDLVQLHPGDRLFWHTKGLLTVPNVQGQVWRVDRVLRSLLDCFEAYGEKTEKISGGLADQAKEYFAIISDNPPDDITLVIATVPSKAKFSKRVEAA